MTLFIENAKTYVQLSGAALLLSVTFLREIVGIPKDQSLPMDEWLIASWICFLVAVIFGATYQYFAVKFLEWKSGVERTHGNLSEWLIQHPWPFYGVMLGAFYLRAVLFTIFAIGRLKTGG